MKSFHFIKNKHRFYFKILCLSIISFIFFISLFLSYSLYTGYNNINDNICNIEKAQNEIIEKNYNSNFSQLSIKISNISKLSMPLDYIESNDLYWSKNIFNTMINNNFAGIDYISYFKYDMPNYNYCYSNMLKNFNPEDYNYKVGLYSPYEFYINKNGDWPFYLIMKTPNSNYNSVSYSITINTFALSDYIFSNQNESNRYEYIVSSSGTIILTNDTKNTFKAFSDLYPNVNISDVNKIKQSKINNKDYYMLCTASETSDLYYVSFVPKSNYTQDWITLLVTNIFIACLMLILSILLSKKMVSSAYRPIDEMITTLQYYIPTDIEPFETEASFLIDKMKETLNDKQKLEIQLPITMQKLQEVQFAAMQSQINAHFLFNTLENIKSISVNSLGIDNSIENSILLLNNILYETMHQKKSVIMLEKEISLATDYLELMKLRFEKFTYEIKSDISLNKYSVFKFSIQPVLENCFVHAFKNKNMADSSIQITTFSEKENLYISITDNGCGFDPSVIELINNSTNKSLLKNQDVHLGLQNINTRIHSVFGNEYGLKIKNNEIGATVTIQYPITIFENHNSL